MILDTKYKKPILLVGNGVRTANAVDTLHDYARKTDIPILTTMNGVDLAQGNLHIGFIGTHGNRVANMILNECDLIISIGARLGIRQVGRFPKNFGPKADLIRCDIDEYELSRDIKRNEKKFHSDAKDFIRLLSNEETRDFSGWKKRCLQAKKLLSDYDKQPGNLAVETISAMLPENPVVAVDVGMHQCWCAQSLELKGTRGRIHISGGYGTMGCAVPFAIGSSISLDKGIVYCICGDGGFQMNIQELETIVRERLPIKIFILNNQVLGKISETQYFDNAGRCVNTTFEGGYSTPDFKKIAEAYGIRAMKFEFYENLKSYSEWFYDSEPCLFDISLPKESFLTPKIKFETGKTRPELGEDIMAKVYSILGE